MNDPLLSVRGLRVDYGGNRAVDDIEFTVGAGEILGIVGESGSGKTTIARAIAGFTPTTSGELELDGAELGARRTAEQRQNVQMVFQDPYLSLNPRLTTWSVLRELIVMHRLAPPSEVDAAVRALLGQVSLTEEHARVRPVRLSGGQRQRAAIARALAVRPRLVIADEPTSALDVSVQGAILRLFASLRDELGVGFIVISHDLALVRFLCDNVLVLSQGTVVERGAVAQVLDNPKHPYTRRLLAAAPRLPAYATASPPQET